MNHGCITCADEAIPMRVTALEGESGLGGESGLARCERHDGRRETVETALVESVAVGEWLLVHAGTALGRAPAGEGRRA